MAMRFATLLFATILVASALGSVTDTAAQAQTPGSSDCKGSRTITVTGTVADVRTFDAGRLLVIYVGKGASPCHPGVVHTTPGPGREKCVRNARFVATGKMDRGDEGDALLASQVRCE